MPTLDDTRDLINAQSASASAPALTQAVVEPAPARRSRLRRIVWRSVLALTLLLLLAGAVIFLTFDSVARRRVEERTTRAINLETTVSAVAVHPLSGQVDFTDFRIESPPGFSTRYMLVVPTATMQATIRQLRSDPVQIDEITLDRPTLVIEAADGTLNLQRMVERIPHPAHPTRLRIVRVNVRDATVILRRLPGLTHDVSAPVASFSVDNLGADQSDGEPIKEVVTQLLMALANHASDAPQIPLEYRDLLKGNLGAVFRIALPGAMGTLLGGLTDWLHPARPATRATVRN